MNVNFEARLWINLNSVEYETWSYELEPVDIQHRSTAEWALSHLDGNFNREDWLEEFKLDGTKCWQVIFKGSLYDWYDCFDEYEEEMDILEFQTIEIPQRALET